MINFGRRSEIQIEFFRLFQWFLLLPTHTQLYRLWWKPMLSTDRYDQLCCAKNILIQQNEKLALAPFFLSSMQCTVLKKLLIALNKWEGLPSLKNLESINCKYKVILEYRYQCMIIVTMGINLNQHRWYLVWKQKIKVITQGKVRVERFIGVREKLEIEKRLKERSNNNNNNKTINIVNGNNSNKTINNVSNDGSGGNKYSSNNRIVNKVNNDTKVTGIINSGDNKNNVETVTRNDDRVKDLEVIDERNLLKEKFTEIIVVEIPEMVVPVRRSFGMEIKIIHDSKLIKRNYGRRSPEEFRLITEKAVGLFKLDIIEESVSNFHQFHFYDTLERTKNAKWFSNGFHLLNLVEGRQYSASRMCIWIEEFTGIFQKMDSVHYG
ncbi:hypothetical protein ACTA71_000581 [Dictyostelium dimigraforme]